MNRPASVYPSHAVPGAAVRHRRARPGIRMSLPLMHLYGVWALTLFDLHFFLGAMVASPLQKIVHLGYPPLILMMLLQGPMLFASSRRWVWYPALLVWLAVAVINVPSAVDFTGAKSAAQYLLIYYVIGLATAVYVRTPRQAMPIILMLGAQFAWWALWGRLQGLVPWHPTLSNYDGFGGLMVMGAGLCYWLGMASRSRRMRMVWFALAGYAVLGVVMSFARGAFLSLVALGAWIWVRSPRKLAAAGYGIGGAIIVVVAASLMQGGDFFWNEIASAFHEGTEEGTGAQRWSLWKVGFAVFGLHPVLGVGGSNVGAFAATHFRPGELEAFPNPMMLWGYNMHNSYVQILAEFGLIGSLAFVAILVDFVRCNRALRTQAAEERWTQQTGGRYRLHHVALALEAANVANLLSGVFYATLFMPWFFTIWFANRMLWAVTRPPAHGRRTRRPVTTPTRTGDHHSPPG